MARSQDGAEAELQWDDGPRLVVKVTAAHASMAKLACELATLPQKPDQHKAQMLWRLLDFDATTRLPRMAAASADLLGQGAKMAFGEAEHVELAQAAAALGRRPNDFWARRVSQDRDQHVVDEVPALT